MFSYSRAALIVTLLALTATACRKKQPEAGPQQPVVSNPTPNNPPPANPPNNNPPPTTTPDRAAAIRETTSNLMSPLYFAYDMAEISAESRSNLDMKINIMRANTAVVIRIEGHADNRGSTEYNIALGQRRADAAKQYMVDRGIPANRITTVSLGEEKPAMQGENEAAWSKNRRDEFAITAGTITTPVGNQ